MRRISTFIGTWRPELVTVLVFVVFQPILGFFIFLLSGGDVAVAIFAALMFVSAAIIAPDQAVAPIFGLGILPALVTGLVAATLRGTHRFWLFCLGAIATAGLAELSVVWAVEDFKDLAGAAFPALAGALAAVPCAALSYWLGRRARA